MFTDHRLWPFWAENSCVLIRIVIWHIFLSRIKLSDKKLSLPWNDQTHLDLKYFSLYDLIKNINNFSDHCLRPHLLPL